MSIGLVALSRKRYRDRTRENFVKIHISLLVESSYIRRRMTDHSRHRFILFIHQPQRHKVRFHVAGKVTNPRINIGYPQTRVFAAATQSIG